MPLFSLDKDAPFFIAGHRGMAGSALWRLLESEGFTNLVGISSADLNLTDRPAVFEFMEKVRPKYLVLAAAKVGGILANDKFPVQFLSENLQIQVNVMDAALEYDVERLVFLGSSCIYPKNAPQPLKEEYLLTGTLEPTNDAYAIAKIAGIMHVQAARRQFGKHWISVMPTNLYGPGDNYLEGESHVLAALIHRFLDAKVRGADEIVNWGTGSPLREFLYVDDFAEAILVAMQDYDSIDPINVGSGFEVSIKQLSELIRSATGFQGKVRWDNEFPDGTPRKLLDSTKIAGLGFTARTTLEDGIAKVLAGLGGLPVQ